MDNKNVPSKRIIKIGKKKLNIKRSYDCRLIEFNALDGPDLNTVEDSDSSNEDEIKTKNNPRTFNIQMFGIDECGKKYSVTAINYNPYFYVKVGDHWDNNTKISFLKYILRKIPHYKGPEVKDIHLVESKKLYGFDNEKLHKFIMLRFTTISCFYTVKKLWYKKVKDELNYIEGGLKYNNEQLPLYEGHIPPLIRMFHIKDINPSGWVRIHKKDLLENKGLSKKTTCDYEFVVDYNKIEALREKETPVPYKICSFDIEASSSHGDFPIPIKTYKKFCDQFLDIFESFYFKDYNSNKTFIVSQDKLNNVFNIESITYYLEIAIKKSLYHEDNFHKGGYLPNQEPSIASNIADGEVVSIFNKYIDLFIDKLYIKEKFNDYTEFIAVCKEALNSLHDAYITFESLEDTTQTMMKYFERAEVSDKPSFVGSEGDIDEDWGDDMDSHTTKNKPSKKKVDKNQRKLIDSIVSSLSFDIKTKNIKLLNKELSVFLDAKLTDYFPNIEGDKVTFIGSTFRKNGEDKPYLNHCLVLGECADVEGSVVQSCDTEQDVLLQWSKIIQSEDPDIIIGYNIFGFDYLFMFNRAKENDIVEEFLKLSRNKGEISGRVDYQTKEISLNKNSIRIASGEHNLYYPLMTGRLQVDLYNYFRREFNLEMYKLDFTAGYFISDKIKAVDYNNIENKTKITSRNLVGLENNAYIKIKETSHSDNYYLDGVKFIVSGVNFAEGSFFLEGNVSPDMTKQVSWCLAKDDVTPQQIFQYTNEGVEKKAIVAKYCIQDCNLVQELLKKIDVLTGFIEMSNICSVPLSFIVLRGQGIKLTSYISKKCKEKNTLMPTLNKKRNNDGYEGAIVLEPKTNLYLEKPIACVDYSSLYPSSMISENLCHSSKVWTKTYDLEGSLINYTGETHAEDCHFVYDNLPNMKYVNIEFDTYKYIRKTAKAAAIKVKNGKKICRFAQYNDKKAILPSVLEELLEQRKATKKLKAMEKDPFMKNIYDKRQISIKLTANSIYGQTGAGVGDFYEPDVAASTTATGRKMLIYGQRVIEDVYGDTVCATKNHGDVRSNAEYIYGDTDSVFFCFNLKEMDGTPIEGQKALEITIELAKEVGELASSFLKNPHDLEYEKTFLPFCLLSKKRYVGMLYENDPSPNAGYRKSMGIVLKRRDNAPIVKDVYGGIIDILMKEKSIDKSLVFLNDILKKLVEGKVPMDKLIITKSLRGHYANPKQIAHKVLADRVTLRDPGNKPNAGDRIPFVYIENSDKKALQGDRIELPDYVIKHKLNIDYSHYITNQIMKPVLQLYALVLEQLPSVKNKPMLIKKIKREIESYKTTLEHDKFIEKRDKIRSKYVQKYLFDKTINQIKVKKEKNQIITSAFNMK